MCLNNAIPQLETIFSTNQSNYLLASLDPVSFQHIQNYLHLVLHYFHFLFAILWHFLWINWIFLKRYLRICQKHTFHLTSLHLLKCFHTTAALAILIGQRSHKFMSIVNMVLSKLQTAFQPAACTVYIKIASHYIVLCFVFQYTITGLKELCNLFLPFSSQCTFAFADSIMRLTVFLSAILNQLKFTRKNRTPPFRCSHSQLLINTSSFLGLDTFLCRISNIFLMYNESIRIRFYFFRSIKACANHVLIKSPSHCLVAIMPQFFRLFKIIWNSDSSNSAVWKVDKNYSTKLYSQPQLNATKLLRNQTTIIVMNHLHYSRFILTNTFPLTALFNKYLFFIVLQHQQHRMEIASAALYSPQVQTLQKTSVRWHVKDRLLWWL